MHITTVSPNKLKSNDYEYTKDNPVPTENLEIGDKYPISFGGLEFNNSYIEIVGCKKTTVKQLGHIDAFKNGYSFKPFFIEHLKEQGFCEEDVVLKVDFRLIE